MKKAIISSYAHWTSFGSMLQAIALQKVIQNMGLEVETLVFEKDEIIPAVKKEKFRPNISYLQYLYKYFNRRRLDTSREASLSFMKSHLHRCVLVQEDDLKNNYPEADIYIAGSDQIWHPALCREDFFLSYAPKEKKRISYAASMGILDIPESNEKRFAELLQNIESFSVREEGMLSIIQKYTGKPVLQHIDPTFLVSAEDWRQYESAYNINEPYILVYALYWNRALNKQLMKLHKKTGYRIISIQNCIRPIYANSIVLDAGPAEFLWLVDHAEAVVTSSFHGVAFSVIFNKRFYPVVNPKAPSRIDSLFKMLKINRPSSLEKLMDFTPDYSEVNIRMEHEKERSMEYLRNEINGEK